MATGEKKMFLEIWEEREHKCVLCDKFLGWEPNIFYFSHILTKGAYPKFRLNKDNIMLNCMDCHIVWDNGDASKLKNHKEWKEKKEELKSQYYAAD
jgi:hypothetical protein